MRIESKKKPAAFQKKPDPPAPVPEVTDQEPAPVAEPVATTMSGAGKSAPKEKN